ncbi:hypothetical protein B0T13DRAFT_404357 [Neurospora crassa]|nr:hypothetical protein B0T13DRAFT_404357 [Neurospora crassa]
MTMERNLVDWLPDDAPWALLNVPTLEKQCAARNLRVSGGKWEMVKNLNRHQEIHGTEERNNSRWGRTCEYVLRYVLDCPEPLRWQQSFLSPELEDIYRHSHAVSTLLLTNWKSQDPRCALCFKAVVPEDKQRTCCFTCGRVMHTDCVGVARKVRGLAKEEQCWRCEDETEWGIDKYCKPGQVQYPLIVPGTKAAPQTQPGPGGNTAQQPNERTENGAVTTEDLGLWHGEHSGKLSNNPSPINAGPIPDTAIAPGSAAIPDIAPALASGAASVKDLSLTSTNINISNRNSVILERYRGRLAKKSAEMQKQAKRKYKKLNKKHMKDLAKLWENSKRELKRFMKKSKKLEKKAKGVGGGREECDDA